MIKLLVIEDDASLRELLSEVLSDAGYELLMAENGQTGLELARLHLPKLILSDVMMPRLDGHGVLAALRSDPTTAHIPFIFLTTLNEKDQWRRAMNLGADDYINKPIQPDDLLHAIQSRLAKYAAAEKRTQDKLDELRRNVVYLLPHEFRTPLTSVLGYADLLIDSQNSLTPAEINEYALSIRRAGERLERLIENYLLYSELDLLLADSEEAQALRQVWSSSTQYLITEAATQTAQQARRQTTLRLAVVDARVAMADPYLRKIVTELVDNALKFSRSNQAVEVTGEIQGAFYQLTVLDHGSGMTAAQMEHIGAYMQFDRKQREQQGAGMGLSLVKRLAELHNGLLELESTAHQFTRVIVKLPRIE